MRRSITNLLAPAAVALALLTLTACDTGEGPPEEVRLIQRVDTVRAVVGETARYDLDVLFAEVGEAPERFNVLRQPEGGRAWVEGARGERLAVLSQVAGTDALSIEAQVRGNARYRAEVAVRVGGGLDPHTCTPVEPVADYFPIEDGQTWTFRYWFRPAYNQPGGIESGTEVWEVEAVSACTGGRRPYSITRTKTPDGGTPTVSRTFLYVSGSFVSFSWSNGQWDSLQRLYPGATSDSITEFVDYGGAGFQRVELVRDVGISEIEEIGPAVSGYSSSYRLTRVTS